ncbi:hypothetical protein L1987_30789 [Smallanthus sonchifolius]|uniref:Uncharacterized protein n=1 Tax=Smallanthus sonchifolius TaxID=185202 RepID=A0ACB9I3P7_9ASTR|nr:hypothetical protein L1987_30789 [Smallanthus sonchifolius]
MASSSTSFIKESYHYDVFLSFSGEDTRKNFVDHLYDALQKQGIQTFKDDERLEKGKGINGQLLKSIEESKFFIIVFSKKYASPSWCLNELVKIMECQKSNEQIAYSVFYDVDPSEVRKQRGPVGEALARHINIETGKWREALTEAANLAGWDLRNTADGHEAKVIKLIVERISLELRSINVNFDDKLVGMESRVQDLQKSLDISSNDVRMIGIKGMGGAGKTTLARAAFDRLSIHFEAKSFVENVREVSKASMFGLLSLQRKILSDLLNGQDKAEWIDALARLKKNPLKETLEKLELSYESLEDDYKEIFLDIACLLKGWEKNKAIRMLESCGFHARNGLRVLEQRSLITFNASHFAAYLSMHDHIEEMGKNIVRRLHLDDPNNHSRLWIQEEIEDVLGNDLGTEVTRCINLKLTPEIVMEGLGNMKKLRCLIVNNRDNDKDCDNLVKIDEVSQYFPNALRYLNWHHYPHWCLPNTFRANNLVALEMFDSRIEQLWEGGKVLKKLKSIELRSSKLRTLDLGLTPNLVRLDLQSCYDLVELHVPVGCLKRLVYLDVGFCERLKSVSFIKELESLEVLNLNGLHLKEFPDIIPSHSNSSLQLGNLHKLVYLSLICCRKLKSLPVSICSLQHLRVLDLERCGIEELPEDIGQLECLEKLDLTYSKVKHLPNSICMLKHLKTLLLQECKVLDKLPEDLCQLESLEELNLKYCKIRLIPSSICKLKHLKTLILEGCEVGKLPEDFDQMESLTKLSLRLSKIREIPSNICKLKHLKELDLSVCSALETLPENLGDLECLEKLNLMGTSISHLPHSISLLKGLRIVGYKKRIDPDALLSQKQQQTIHAPKRRSTKC